MWPLYLSAWRVGSGGSTAQVVHMNSGRKRLANGLEMCMHSPIPGEADDYLGESYLGTYCVDSRTIKFLLRQTGQALQRSITRFWQPISPAKRLAMCLHWLIHGITLTSLASYIALVRQLQMPLCMLQFLFLKTFWCLLQLVFLWTWTRRCDEWFSGYCAAADVRRCWGWPILVF